jgi:sec-independent protein translocase protein TatB
MFDIGFSEIVVIFGLALIVLGPDKLPKIAQTVGRWAGRARAMARQFRDQLEQEANQLKTDIDPNKPLRGEPPQREAPPAATGPAGSEPAGSGPAASAADEAAPAAERSPPAASAEEQRPGGPAP